MLPVFEPSAESFLHKTTIIYGVSGSGKSHIIVDIMSYLKDLVPICHVFCPTDGQNKTYSNRLIPSQLVYENLSEKKLNRIFDRQQMITASVKLSDDLNIITKLYQKLLYYGGNDINYHYGEQIRKIESLKSIVDKYELDFKHAAPDDIQKCEEQLAKARKILITYLKDLLYRTREYFAKIDLDTVEKSALDYNKVNPNALIIFDDCSEDLKKMKNSKILESLFYRARHANITVIMACHADTVLMPAMKQNAFLNIFTSPQTAKAYFHRGSIETLPKSERDALDKIIQGVFKDHQKLVCNRVTNKKYRFTARSHPGNFRFCHDLVWTYCDRVKSEMGVNYNFFAD